MGCSASSTASASPHSDRSQLQSDRHVVPSKLSRATLEKRDAALVRAQHLFAQTTGQKFHDNYIRTTLVSYGANCKVLTAVHRATGKRYAAKAIPKDPRNADQWRNVLMEVGVMAAVEDHPNAVQLFEVYDDPRQYYLVMEYCEGGELFDHISKSLMGLTERQAAQILRSIMQFLVHMHSKGIAHMDIKPENIMFDSEGADGILKIIDFGASVYVQPDEHVRDAFGTVRYSSPEMANDVGIGQKTDVWSAGVVMYLMLCGAPPFIKSSDVDTLNYIKKAPRVKFSGNRWSLISPAAKDCIRAMLEPDAAKRPTAAQVLNLPWLRSQVPDQAIRSDILHHLRAFANHSRMRRMLLGLMAANLTGGEANRLLSQFYLVDVDSSGTIELPELVLAAQKVLPDVSEAEVARVFSALDVDDTGSVDLREFFAGLLHTMDTDMQSSLALKSFSALDKDSEGFVRLETFVTAMVQQAQAAGLCTGTEEVATLRRELEAEFKALDANHDGVLSFEEYKSALSLVQQQQQEQLAARGTSTSGIPGPPDATAAGTQATAAAGTQATAAGAQEAAAGAEDRITANMHDVHSQGGMGRLQPIRVSGTSTATSPVPLPPLGAAALSRAPSPSRSQQLDASPVVSSMILQRAMSQQRQAEEQPSPVSTDPDVPQPVCQHDPASASHQNLIRLALEVTERKLSGPASRAASRRPSGLLSHSRSNSVLVSVPTFAVGLGGGAAQGSGSAPSATTPLTAVMPHHAVPSQQAVTGSVGPQGEVVLLGRPPSGRRTPRGVYSFSNCSNAGPPVGGHQGSLDGKEAISAVVQLLERQPRQLSFSGGDRPSSRFSRNSSSRRRSTNAVLAHDGFNATFAGMSPALSPVPDAISDGNGPRGQGATSHEGLMQQPGGDSCSASHVDGLGPLASSMDGGAHRPSPPPRRPASVGLLMSSPRPDALPPSPHAGGMAPSPYADPAALGSMFDYLHADAELCDRAAFEPGLSPVASSCLGEHLGGASPGALTRNSFAPCGGSNDGSLAGGSPAGSVHMMPVFRGSLGLPGAGGAPRSSKEGSATGAATREDPGTE